MTQDAAAIAAIVKGLSASGRAALLTFQDGYHWKGRYYTFRTQRREGLNELA